MQQIIFQYEEKQNQKQKMFNFLFLLLLLNLLGKGEKITQNTEFKRMKYL